MAYPFSNLTELRDFIEDNVTANGNREITGPEVRDSLKGILDLIAPILQQQLTVALSIGQTVGGAGNGDVFAQGDTLESVLRKILIKTVAPTYVAPTIVLGSSIAALSQELGSIISPILTSTFTQNNAGALSGISLKKNAVQIATTSPFTDTGALVSNTPLSYQTTATYAQGACINNNLGVQDCTGRILAGSVLSNIITYTGFRKVFWGTPVIVPATSADIRSALTNTTLNPQNGTQFTINIPLGAQRVVFAYPASLENIASVVYRELSNAEVKDNFIQSLINVEGANGFAAISYKVYTYTPVEPFPSAVTYDVTI